MDLIRLSGSTLGLALSTPDCANFDQIRSRRPSAPEVITNGRTSNCRGHCYNDCADYRRQKQAALLVVYGLPANSLHEAFFYAC